MKQVPLPTSRILITGASSGIGEALARALSRAGAHLVLVSRDPERLAAVAASCRVQGAEVDARPIDVTDRAAMERMAAETGPFDLVFANAGVAYGVPESRVEPAAQVRTTFAVNVDGVMNTVLPAVEQMRARRPGPNGIRGRIVVVSSVAAFIPYPNSPSYCASKAAVDVWTVATAANLAPLGIVLTSVCPGFVRTPMTAPNDFPMPGLVDVDEAVARILRGVAAGRRRVTFPGWIGAGSKFVGALPARLREAILERQPSKAPAPLRLSEPERVKLPAEACDR